MGKQVINIDPDRVRQVKTGHGGKGPVIYWMIRDQRVDDNWSLLFAQQIASDRDSPLAVLFCASKSSEDRSPQQSPFMMEGLKQVEKRLEKHNIRLVLLSGPVPNTVLRFASLQDPSAMVMDFSPLRTHIQWQARVAARAEWPVFEVDAHNVVPCRYVSEKREYAAYTLRPKLRKLLPRFLTEFPRLPIHRIIWKHKIGTNQWSKILGDGQSGSSSETASRLKPGSRAAMNVLRGFLKRRLVRYADARNDPTEEGQSNLSPYLHFGHISAQRVALEVEKHNEDYGARDAFLEELIVRRELSDNFCLHCDHYDSFDGFPEWAQTTLNDHSLDPRPYLYAPGQFEKALTHDDLWNAAQREMVIRGKMHGYLRMYWAKKILEWSPSPRDALHTAIYLNDKYELDGYDPNGYAGVAWSIGGLHDRPWSEREVFGKIRYMSYQGCRRKFDVRKYVDSIKSLQ